MNDNPLKQAFDETQQRTQLADAVYAALRSAGKIQSHRVISYRCNGEGSDRPRRCLLLDVINIPQGVIFHQPAYKLSPSVNSATSSAAGRARNTVDGVNHWTARTYFATECVNVSMSCDHVKGIVIEKDEIGIDIDARHAEVMVKPSGERSPI